MEPNITPNPNPEYREGSRVRIQMQPVKDSSSILAAGYDEPNHVLAVRFLSSLMDGKAYLFRPVPKEVFEAFMEAESKGRFFHQHIRGNIGKVIDGGYEWTVAHHAPDED